MKKLNLLGVVILLLLSFSMELFAQKTVIVRPVEIDDVLVNPGIGFMTFQRFNGDTLNNIDGGSGWTEGFPIDYQKFNGNLKNRDYPLTSIAYFRIYWRFIEPEKGKYNWTLIDNALIKAKERHQTLMLRIAPYGTSAKTDVPDWYRKMVGDENNWAEKAPQKKWLVNPENPFYAEYFGRLIEKLGQRYDGHPDLESVDLAIVGAWGEGAGSNLLKQTTRERLVNAYTDNFKKTPLVMLLTDKKTNEYGLSQANVGWRVDCLGDLGFWATEQNCWTHMYNYYPQNIIRFGMRDAWKKAPVSLEICGTFYRWKDREEYGLEDVKYIFDESLKWHISSFNAKSAPVPKEWEPLVNEWLKKMGYRFVLRSFSYPEFVSRNENLTFETWWDNKGVAPCYKDFLFAIRIKNSNKSKVFLTDADIKTWLPGDNIYDNSVFIPAEMPTGKYEIQVGIVDRQLHRPQIKLAIEGRDQDGWYTLGEIKIVD